MRSLFPQKYHYYLFLFSLSLLVIGMPLSKFLMSLSQIILICNWIIEGNQKSKWISFFKNKAALAASSILLLHFFGLLYTSDFDYAFKDIRIKLPLLVLPLVLSTSTPLSLKVKHNILKLFILSILVGTFISTLILSGVIHRQLVDIRNASIFISHIRFALLICVAIFSCIYFFMELSLRKERWIYGLIALWLFVFLIMIGSMTGISALFIAGGAFFIYQLTLFSNKLLKYSVFSGIVLLIFAAGYFMYNAVNRDVKTDVVDESKLELCTAQGNDYHHEPLKDGITENGHYIWIYYCEKEVREEWNNRSQLNFDGEDKKGNLLKYTLARFMTSKNLRKDAEGMKQLSDEEIRLVERGVPNVNDRKLLGIKGRINETIWEIKTYKQTGDANGHSLTQRFEFWKAACGIISDHLIFGVGTGDIQKAFDAQYEKTNSSLTKEFRLRSHNQYLSITVAFGLFGLLWFFFALIYPAYKQKMFFSFLYFTFFIVATISFLTEDTLETQAGVTFFAFLNSFFLFGTKNERVRSH